MLSLFECGVQDGGVGVGVRWKAGAVIAFRLLFEVYSVKVRIRRMIGLGLGSGLGLGLG